MKDEPPRIVVSTNAGEIPRYSGQRQARGAALRGRAQQAVDIAQPQPAIIERPLDALRHQVDRTHVRGDRTQIGLGDADDRRRAALQPVHQPASTGTKTG
jgi:hypothetical protein